MCKHETGYARVELDQYLTLSPWVVPALDEHVALHGLTVHEFACGQGHMAGGLRLCGACVYCSDVIDHGNGHDEVLDFLSDREPKLAHFDALISNPPYGERNSLIVPFIKAGSSGSPVPIC
jgi:predicted RNA methylase